MRKKIVFLLLAMTALTQSVYAQCAMCRATLENNVSNGNVGIAAGINTGILYLFFAPYLAVGVIAFFWFRASRRNAQAKFTGSHLAG
ncbi:MAG: hypothetical protein ACK5DD_12125 [Cyclobacteriaceae bacterium]|jgi:hypothetical protein